MTLLEQAEAAGLTVRADGDILVIRGPRRLDPLAKRPLANKPLVMAVLAATAAPTLTPTRRGYSAPSDLPERWQEYCDERAAIREYDGNQPRERAVAEAWTETVAAMRAANRA